MKLFLASEAKHPLSIEKLREFIGGFEGKSIAYIPTAANGEGINHWIEGGSWNTVQRLGANVTLTLLEDCTSESALEKMTGKDIIWFAGGMCGYLMYWIRRRQIDIHIRKLLEAGAVYVGSSAGSMVAGASLEVIDWYPNEDEFGASIIPTMQLVDFDIFPHYEESMLDVVKENYKGKKLYLLKNGEEVIVDGDTVTVIGEERIFP